MDKLRGMEYLVRVVQGGSFAAAARELEVSPSAVTQMIAALERELGVTLLVRSAKGVTLTSDGERYHRICGQALADLRAAESDLRNARNRVSGLLVAGIATRLARNCIVPELPRFLARHPDLSIDIRSVHTSEESLAALCDVLLISAWQHHEELVERNLAQLTHMTCASPAYWLRHGKPRHPQALREHVTLAWRTSQNIVLDEWRYRRGTELQSVSVQPRIVSDDRDSSIELALRGFGIVRVGDLIAWKHIAEGALERALTDWEGLDAPPIRLLYRRGTGGCARVRVFTAFVEEVFAGLKRQRAAAGYGDPAPQPPPDWFLKTNRYPRNTAASG